MSRLKIRTKIFAVCFLLSGCSLTLGNQERAIEPPVPVKPIFSSKGHIDTPVTSLEVIRRFLIVEQEYEEKKSVMVIYASDSGRGYPWLYLRPIGVEYTSDRRALEVANRLEKYRLQKLNRLAWGTTRYGQEIICARTEQEPNNCQIVVTVAPGIDPQKVLIILQCKLKNIEEGSPLCAEPVES